MLAVGAIGVVGVVGAVGAISNNASCSCVRS